MTQEGDRLDNLAFQFYGNQHLWWYIAHANNLNTMKEKHDLQNPTGEPIEHTSEYLNSLTDKQLRDEDKSQTKILHEAKLSDAHGSLAHEANQCQQGLSVLPPDGC